MGKGNLLRTSSCCLRGSTQTCASDIKWAVPWKWFGFGGHCSCQTPPVTICPPPPPPHSTHLPPCDLTGPAANQCLFVHGASWHVASAGKRLAQPEHSFQCHYVPMCVGALFVFWALMGWVWDFTHRLHSIDLQDPVNRARLFSVKMVFICDLQNKVFVQN